MKLAANEITKGKNLEMNLPSFGSKLMNIYNNYSFVRLSMNYYTYYEMVNEDAVNDSILQDLLNKFNKTVELGVINPVMGENQVVVLKQIEEIRAAAINVMKGLTSLADIFNIFEYVLNRVEYRFKDIDPSFKEDDATFVASVMSYILSDKDNVVMNTRICETVRQLPLRMTKAKFTEMLHTGLMVYKDSEKQSFEDFIYMLKTSAMLEVDANAFVLSSDIKKIYDDFLAADFTNLTKEQYEDLFAKLNFVTSFIEERVNKYMMLSELINDVYVIVLSNHYVNEVPTEHKACTNIISILYDRFLSKDKLLDDFEVENYFYELEGKQEEYHREFSQVEHILEMVLENYMEQCSSFMIDNMYNSLGIIKLLESGSIFVEFNTDKAEGSCTTEYIEEIFEKLMAEFMDFFKNHTRQINRAVMASVLSSLPIFFGNIDEINKYVLDSISSCTDEAERIACCEIFHSLMD